MASVTSRTCAAAMIAAVVAAFAFDAAAQDVPAGDTTLALVETPVYAGEDI